MHAVFRADLFAGKRVLITGGATGIGFGIAQGFAQLGAHVTVLSRTESNLKQAIAKLGSKAAYHVADATGMVKLDAMENPYSLPDALRDELAHLGSVFNESTWFSNQLRFLRSHSYFTPAARALRAAGSSGTVKMSCYCRCDQSIKHDAKTQDICRIVISSE